MTDQPQVRAKDVGDLMQPLLVDLIALAQNGKQAHWHVRGKTFTQVHEQLDTIIDDARSYADEVAERVVALGVDVDGRPATVSAKTTVPPLVSGFVEVEAVVIAVAEQLDATIATARGTLAPLGELDPASQDVVVELLRGLEKHHWMLQAQT